MKKTVISTLVVCCVVVLLLVASFVAGKKYGISTIDLETKVRVDTIVQTNVVFDTVFVKERVPVYVPKYDTITRTVLLRDTVLVAVPISQYTRQDTDYFVQVSGFGVTFDKIEVYPKTIYETKYVKQKSRWGLGVQVGYGFMPTSGNIRASPYIGIGVNYNFLTW